MVTVDTFPLGICDTGTEFKEGGSTGNFYCRFCAINKLKVYVKERDKK